MLSSQQLGKYQEMGFNTQEIQLAAKTAKERNVDILDVLLKSVPQPDSNNRPQAIINQARASKPQTSFKYRPYFKPKNKLKIQKYNCAYSQEEGGIKQQIMVEQIREKGFPPVLENVSNCCYLNSLLMAYYLMPELVKIVMKAVPLQKQDLDSLVSNNLKNKRIQNSYNLLKSIQNLFANLTLSTKKTLNPSDILKNLVDYFGNKITYGEEKDLNQINYQFISRLQQCLYYTKQNLENLKKDGVISSGIKSTINQSPIKQKQRQKQGGIPQLKDILFGTKIQISTQGEFVQQQQSQFLSFLLNPIHRNLYKCLDQQLHYQIDDKGITINKDVWIAKQPQYLFFYFQQTSFDKSSGAVKLKNRIDFDFRIYLDRYLYKNKEVESKKNPILVQLIKKKQKLTQEISYCKSLILSLEQCYESSKHLSKQIIELPSLQHPKKYLEALQSELSINQKQLSALESRKDPYDLKYIILHRGSASSGHYWGYGCSQNWWRYDLQNEKVDEEKILKQIDSGDTVVYALIYSRSRLHINPSYDKFLRIPEPDLLNIEQYYDWIPNQTQTHIISQNIKRQQAVQQRRIWQSFEQITLQYDEMICDTNKLKLNIQQFGGEQPYLSSFLVYLRSLSRQPSNSFKVLCLDIAIKKVTKKYSVLEQPSIAFSNQLKQVIKNNISQQNIPDRFTCSKFDMDKLKQKELEYQQRVKMRIWFNLLLDNLKNKKWRESADCALLILNQNVKDSMDCKYAEQLLSVLIIKIHSQGETIPINYLKSLERADKKLSTKISSFVNIIEEPDTAYLRFAKDIANKKITQIANQGTIEVQINKMNLEVARDTMMELKSIMSQYKRLL